MGQQFFFSLLEMYTLIKAHDTCSNIIIVPLFTLEKLEKQGKSRVKWFRSVLNFLAPGTSFAEEKFSMDQGEGWFWDYSSALHLLHILFLLLHQLCLRSSGTRSQSLGTSG